MRAGLFLVAALTGCGRLGFEGVVATDSGTDANAALPTPLLEVPIANTGAINFEPIQGAAMDLPASPGVSWLLLVSASLHSTSGQAIAVEARYLVDGVERGIGGSQNVAPGRGGPWQHFDVIAGAEAPRRITFELRDAAAGIATISDLRAIAFALPARAAEAMQFESRDAVFDVTSMSPALVAAFPFAPAVPGPYAVLGLVNASDRPGGSDVYVEWRDGAGKLTTNQQLPREAWQSMLGMWIVDQPVATQYELWSQHGSAPGSLRDIRWLALPLDLFVGARTARSTAVVINASPQPVEVVALSAAPTTSAARWIYLATVAVQETCMAGPLYAQRLVGFTAGGTLLHESDHIVDNCASDLTYGTFGVLDAAPDTATITVATGTLGNGDTVLARGGALVVLGLPP